MTNTWNAAKNNNNVFVDMNRTGIWDFRETPTQAWQRLGLLNQGEALTPAAYVSCVQTTAELTFLMIATRDSSHRANATTKNMNARRATGS